MIKTCYQLFEPHVSSKCNNLCLKFNGIELKRSSCCKYLGMFIDEKLKLTEHIKFVYSSSLKYVGIFYKIRQKMPPYCLKKPLLLYGLPEMKVCTELSCMQHTCKSYLNDLMILNNKVLRVLQCKQMDTNTIELYTNFKSLPINLFFLHQALLFTFKFVHWSWWFTMYFQTISECQCIGT